MHMPIANGVNMKWKMCANKMKSTNTDKLFLYPMKDNKKYMADEIYLSPIDYYIIHAWPKQMKYVQMDEWLIED